MRASKWTRRVAPAGQCRLHRAQERGDAESIRTRTLDVHLGRLRSKLADYSREYIATVCCLGHRLQPCADRRVLTEAAGVLSASAGG